MFIRKAALSLAVSLAASTMLNARADDAIAPTTVPTTAPDAAIAEFPPTTPITLHLTDTPVEVILAQLADQAKVSIKTSPENLLADAKPISVDVEYKPFLDVLVDVCRSAGIEPQLGGGGMPGAESTIMLVAPGQGQPRAARTFLGLHVGEQKSDRPSWLTAPTVSTGAFVVTAYHVTATRTVSPGNGNNNGSSLQVQLALMADPAVRLGGVRNNVTADEASDDKGHALLRNDWYGGEDFQRDRQQQGWLVWQPTITLSLPPDVGSKIAKLRAHVQALVITKSDSLSLDNLPMDKPIEKTVAGLRMSVGPVKINKPTVEVPFTIFRDGRSQDQWEGVRQYLYSGGNPRSIRLTDAQGTPMPSMGYSRQGESDGNLQMTLRFNTQVRYATPGGTPATIGDPTKLLWEIPVQARVVDVPVEFADLPIP